MRILRVPPTKRNKVDPRPIYDPLHHYHKYEGQNIISFVMSAVDRYTYRLRYSINVQGEIGGTLVDNHGP